MTTRYILQVLRPGDLRTELAHLESDRPFQAISKGDVLVTRTWKDAADLPGTIRVYEVQHGIWELDGVITHYTTLHTSIDATKIATR